MSIYDTYAALGWRLLPISNTGDKHAGSVLGEGWQHKTSDDPADWQRWFAVESPYRCGLHLGPISGVIDVEADTPEANALANGIFAGVPCPAYTSSRSTHRLFAWDDSMSELGKAVVKYQGIEFRLGGVHDDGSPKGCMSVIPPTEGRHWLDGRSVEDMDPPPLPAWVLDLLRADAAKRQQQATVWTPGPLDLTGDAQHAAAYVAAIPGELEGGRADAAFRVAAVLVRDFALAPDEAYPILTEWAMRCEPPLDDERLLRRKLSEAAKHGKGQHGSKNAPTVGCLPDVDLSCLTPTRTPCVPREPVCDTQDQQEPQTLPDGLLDAPGLIGDVVRHNLATALYPQPAIALCGALALASVLTGRKVQDQRRTRTNLYVVSAAESGSGKDHHRILNKQLLLEAGDDAMCGPERLGSHSGLISVVSEKPAVLLQLDEFDRLLETTKDGRRAPHLFNITTVLMQLYTSSSGMWVSDAYADVKKIKRIDQPHAVVFGTATPRAFWASLTPQNVEDGFIGRMLVLDYQGYPDANLDAGNPSPPDSLVSQVAEWLEFSPGQGNLRSRHPQPVTYPHSAAAKERFQQHMLDVSTKRKDEDTIPAALWSRAVGKTAQLAVLFAASRQGPGEEGVIDLEDVDRAVKLSNYVTRFMLRGVRENVADGPFDECCKRVLRAIGKRGVTRSRLLRATQRMRPRDRDEALKHLYESGQIRVEMVESAMTGGRPATTYLPVSDEVSGESW